jgi:hypothetical protein
MTPTGLELRAISLADMFEWLLAHIALKNEPVERRRSEQIRKRYARENIVRSRSCLWHITTASASDCPTKAEINYECVHQIMRQEVALEYQFFRLEDKRA